MQQKGRCVVSFSNANLASKPAVRSRASLKRLAAALALVVVGGMGLTLAGEEPAKPKDEPPKPKHAPSTRKAKRPPTARIQTNLHTHGLHVSPAGNADNIDVCIKPQQEFTFEYTVPADHPSGTFWYHPHRHGSVAYQLSNGLAGALIVEGSRRDGIADLEDVPEIAAA